MKFLTHFSLGIALAISSIGASNGFAETVTFEGLLSSPETFYNGDNNPGGPDRVVDGTWTAGGVTFENEFVQETFGTFVAQSWSGWAYSNTTDTTTPGFGNQYSAFPGGGSNGAGGATPGSTYALVFTGAQVLADGTPANGATLTFSGNVRPTSVDVTNTTYAAQYMKNGLDSFGTPDFDPFHQFSDGDFLLLRITGFEGENGTGAETGSVDFNLADYGGAGTGDDSLLDVWQTLDLSSIGESRSLMFSSAASQVSDLSAFGLGFQHDVPAYAAIDNLSFVTAIPEPSAAVVLALLGTGCLLRRRR